MRVWDGRTESELLFAPELMGKWEQGGTGVQVCAGGQVMGNGRKTEVTTGQVGEVRRDRRAWQKKKCESRYLLAS